MTVFGFGKYHAQRRATERTYTPHELDTQRDEFLSGVEVVELFNNDVPRVRTELVVKPRGMPPDSWDLIPLASLK